MGGCLCVTGQPHMGSEPLLVTRNLAKDLRAILMVYHAMRAILMLIHWGYLCEYIYVCTVSSDLEKNPKTKPGLHTVYKHSDNAKNSMYRVRIRAVVNTCNNTVKYKACAYSFTLDVRIDYREDLQM